MALFKRNVPASSWAGQSDGGEPSALVNLASPLSGISNSASTSAIEIGNREPGSGSNGHIKYPAYRTAGHGIIRRFTLPKLIESLEKSAALRTLEGRSETNPSIELIEEGTLERITLSLTEARALLAEIHRKTTSPARSESVESNGRISNEPDEISDQKAPEDSIASNLQYFKEATSALGSSGNLVVVPLQNLVPLETAAVFEQRPLRRLKGLPTVFPLEALGNELGLIVLALVSIVRASVAHCAQSLLSVLSLVLQPFADVLLHGRPRPISCFFITFVASGERKGGVDGHLLTAVRERETELRVQYGIDRQRYDREFLCHKAAQSRALRSANPAAVLAAIGTPPGEPRLPFLTTNDATAEGVLLGLAKGQPSFGLQTDEGARFFGGHSMKSENLAKTVAFYSSLWDGTPQQTLRANFGYVGVAGKRFSMHVQLQGHGYSASVLGNQAVIEQGFTARLLMCEPDATTGTRLHRDPENWALAAVGAFNAKIARILRIPLPLKTGTDELDPKALLIDPAAMGIYVDFHDELEIGMADGGPISSIRSFAAKAAEHAVRLAALLTLFNDHDALSISANHMKGGIELARFYLAEHLRLHASAVDNPDLLLAEEVLDWMRLRGRIHSLVLLYQRGPMRVRDQRTARRICRILVDHGWLRHLPGTYEIEGKARRECFELT